jgi:hypothetical protein
MMVLVASLIGGYPGQGFFVGCLNACVAGEPGQAIFFDPCIAPKKGHVAAEANNPIQSGECRAARHLFPLIASRLLCASGSRVSPAIHSPLWIRPINDLRTRRNQQFGPNVRAHGGRIIVDEMPDTVVRNASQLGPFP